MQGWHYGKGLIYYRPIFRLKKLAFPSLRALMRVDQFSTELHYSTVRGNVVASSIAYYEVA